jgi:hypothetical protein
MSSSGIWSRVGLDRTDVSEERVASIFRVQKISVLRKALIVLPTANAFLRSQIFFPEMSVLTRPTRSRIPEDGILQVAACIDKKLYTNLESMKVTLSEYITTTLFVLRAKLCVR